MSEPVELRSRDIRIVPTESIEPNPKNRNAHSDEQIDRLCQIIKYQGFRDPLIISNQSGLLVSGHGRLLAAKKLGIRELPVTFQDFESDEQEYAAMVSENSIASWAELDLSGINTDLGDLGPDFDIDLLGIKDFTLTPVDHLEPQCDEDEVPEQVEPRTKRGDIYQLGRHRLMCGDSTSIDDVERLMGGEVAELCFTSPPYADQREYNGGKELSTEHLATFIRAAYGKVQYFAVNLGYSRKNGEVNPYWDDYIKEAKDSGLRLLSWNIWDKGQAGHLGNQTAMFAISHEWIFVFGANAKDLNRTVKNVRAGETMDRHVRRSDGTIYYSGDKFEVGDVGQLKTVLNMFPQKARNHGIDHPAMFPVGLPGAYIEAMTAPGQIIYEPFTGSGTTLIAAEKTGRICHGMELDPKYVDVIIARFERYSGKKAELTNG